MNSLQKIVIIGGGAGGLELATLIGRTLGKSRLARPVLVDRNVTHIWKPLLHEVATGALNSGEDEVNYFTHGYKNQYEFELGKMSGLDRSQRLVKIEPFRDLKGSVLCKERVVSYDTLVMAVGAVTNDFNTPGVKEHCLMLNKPTQAEFLRHAILWQIFRVITGNVECNKVRVAIVGGGATGVELAAELYRMVAALRDYGGKLKMSQLEITILEGSPRILGAGPPAMAENAMVQLAKMNIKVMTGCGVKGATDQGFTLSDGTLLPAELRIWTAGVKAPDWLKGLGLTTNKLNQIVVNDHLQCVEDSNIYAIGDCSSCADAKTGNFVPPTAQVAHQEAEYLVKKFKADLEGKTFGPFVFNRKGILVSLGAGKAVGSLASMVGLNSDHNVDGIGASLLYSSLYRMHQAVLFGWPKTCAIWLGDQMRQTAKSQHKFN